jgi:hypothetical protein
MTPPPLICKWIFAIFPKIHFHNIFIFVVTLGYRYPIVPSKECCLWPGS